MQNATSVYLAPARIIKVTREDLRVCRASPAAQETSENWWQGNPAWPGGAVTSEPAWETPKRCLPRRILFHQAVQHSPNSGEHRIVECRSQATDPFEEVLNRGECTCAGELVACCGRAGRDGGGHRRDCLPLLGPGGLHPRGPGRLPELRAVAAVTALQRRRLGRLPAVILVVLSAHPRTRGRRLVGHDAGCRPSPRLAHAHGEHHAAGIRRVRPTACVFRKRGSTITLSSR